MGSECVARLVFVLADALTISNYYKRCCGETGGLLALQWLAM